MSREMIALVTVAAGVLIGVLAFALLPMTVIKVPVLSAAFSLLLPALLIVGGAGAVIAISAGAIWGAITAVLIVIGVPLVIMIKAWGFHAFLHR
jgi:hypothetical protein